MYASIRRSRADQAQLEDARKMLEDEIIPRVRQLPGAVAGYWFAPADGMTTSIVVFDSKDDAERPIPNAQPGDSPAPGVTIESVEVREVLGKF